MTLHGRTRSDAAAADIVGTVLLVLAAVVLGSILTVLVTSQLSQTTQESAVSFAVETAEPDDNTMNVTLTNGESIAASALRVTVERNGTGESEIPAGTLTLDDPNTMRPGDKLSFPISPSVRPDETIIVRIYRTDLNVIAGSLTTRSGYALPALAPVTITFLPFSPAAIPADGAAASIASVHVTHEDGLLAVTDVVVKRGNFSRYSFPLRDDGTSGDAFASDGIWSGLVSFPTNTMVNASDILLYGFNVTVTDATGRQYHAGGQNLGAIYPTTVIFDPNATAGDDGSGGTNGTDSTGLYGNYTGNFSGNSTGNFSGNGTGNWTGNASGNFSGSGSGDWTGNFSGNASGNFSGNWTGTTNGNSSGNFSGNGSGNFTGHFSGEFDGAFSGLGAGKRATEGTRIKGPTSTNVTRLTLANWSWDRLSPGKLDLDAMLVHIVAGNATWSVYLKFDYGVEVPKQVPKVTHMRVWNNLNETWYKAAQPQPLETLRLDLLNITTANWTQLANNQIPGSSYINVTNSPYASYQYARIEDNPFLVIAYMRDEQATGQGAKSLDKGIMTVDVEYI